MISRRTVVVASAAVPILARAGRAAATPAPHTIEELTRDPLLRGAVLSPDGSRVAVLSDATSRDKPRGIVNLLDAADLSKPAQKVAIMAEVEALAWANDERLLVWTEWRESYAVRSTDTRVPTKYETSVRRLVALPLDGSEAVKMFDPNTFLKRSSASLSEVVDLLPDDPRHIMMHAWSPDEAAGILYRVDVETGEGVEVERGNQDTWWWGLQDGQAVLRHDINPRGTVERLYARPPGEKAWKFVRQVRLDEALRRDFDIVGVTGDPGVLLARARADGEDEHAIRKFDIRTGEFGEVLARRPGQDATDAMVDHRRRFMGASFINDRVDYDFAEPGLKAHYKGMNAFFENRCNVSLINFEESRNRCVSWVSGPQEPGAYYLYDRTARRLENLGSARPWLAPERLAPMETLAVPTRDGAKITAYLTTPPAAGPAPLIVMPHGGPEARDSYDFDVWAQAFAAQGWYVLQPNFRGSGGYGRAFTEAGRRRWGGRMQEDVEDAIALAAAGGRIDAGRIAIFGISYGGYAALMGAVRRPELYRAAVSVAGVSDLLECLKDQKREEGADSAVYAYWRATIGDPEADAAMLAESSPARRAAEIRAPVLLVHGLNDGIVPPRQSKLMAQALKAAGKPHEHMEIKDISHRGWPAKTRRQVIEKSVEFLAAALRA